MSRTIDFSYIYVYIYIYIYLPYVFRKCKLNSFNPKHCARRSVLVSSPDPTYESEISKIMQYSRAISLQLHTDRVKLPNQRGSKKTGDGAERDRARRAAETADQRSERLRN